MIKDYIKKEDIERGENIWRRVSDNLSFDTLTRDEEIFVKIYKYNTFHRKDDISGLKIFDPLLEKFKDGTKQRIIMQTKINIMEEKITFFNGVKICFPKEELK